MIAIDTNILVYSHRSDSQWNGQATSLLRSVAENRNTWAIPWPCIHEFLSIVTHPRIYAPPSTIRQATEQVEAWMDSPSLVMIGEAGEHWQVLRQLLEDGQIRGPMVHDARIAAICSAQGVSEFLTADRDFSRFPRLETRNPLIAK